MKQRKRSRKRRHLHTMLLASTFFMPHAAKVAPRNRPAAAPTVASVAPPIAMPPSFTIDVATTFRLPPSAYDHLINEAAEKYGISAVLLRAVINAESAFDPMAVSSAGAMGLMQLMPALAAELEVTDPFDARQNILAGTRYLKQLLDAYDGDISLALASYNAGPGAVERYNGVPPYPETQQYVKTITNAIDGHD